MATDGKVRSQMFEAGLCSMGVHTGEGKLRMNR